MEITQAEQQIERQVKHTHTHTHTHKSFIRDLWDNIKCANIHIIGVPDREERKKDIENVLKEIMTEAFPNLKKETDIQV